MDEFLQSKTGQKVIVSAIEEKVGDLAENILNKIGGGDGEGRGEDKKEDKGLDVSNVLSMVAGKDEGSGGAGIAKALGGLFD